MKQVIKLQRISELSKTILATEFSTTVAAANAETCLAKLLVSFGETGKQFPLSRLPAYALQHQLLEQVALA